MAISRNAGSAPEGLKELSTEGVGKWLPTCKRVGFLLGAGFSTNSGIPDFRFAECEGLRAPP